MAFHPEVILTLSELQNQEQLREAAKDRLAASAAAGTRSRPTVARSGGPAAGSWLTGWLTHVRGAKRVQVTSLLASSATPSVH